jgi:hypothetical protein
MLALLSAGRPVGARIATESKRLLVHHEIDIFGKTLDQAPCL